MQSKYYHGAFQKLIEYEKGKFLANQEEYVLDTKKKCPHKQAKIQNGCLVCTCGARWQGPTDGLIEIQQLLSK